MQLSLASTFAPRHSTIAYGVGAGLFAFLGAAGTAGVLAISLIAFGADLSKIAIREVADETSFKFAALTLAPCIETFLLSGIIYIVGKVVTQRFAQTLIVAILCGAAHGPYPFTFVATSLAFFVYANAYISWRPQTYLKAYIAAGSAHLVYNALVVFVSWVLQVGA